MAVISSQLPSAGPVVLLVLQDQEMLAMLALMLELAGFRAVPFSGLAGAGVRAHDIRAHAIVADLRGGTADDWALVQRLQSDSTTHGMRFVVMAHRSDAVPREVIHGHTAIMIWPFALTDLLAILQSS